MKFISILVALLAFCGIAMAENPDPNFYIYLCFGQSNMEGNATPENIDKLDVPDRFKMMAAVDFQNPLRKMYNWYPAVPTLVRPDAGLCPADWFGRTMVDNLPDSVRVGVIVVAIGGCRIEHLDKDFDPATLKDEANWFQSYMACYDNRPYDRLVACAKEAQKAGEIKGMLLHQGCSNNGDQQWCNKVNKIYTDLCTDLDLKPEDTPIFAGELVSSAMGGICGGHNSIINKLPKTISNSYVISSANLPQKGDGLHFTAHGYRVLGCRYAVKALECLGIEDVKVNYSEEIPEVPKPNPQEGDFVFDFKDFNPSIWETGTFNQDTHVWHSGQWGFGGWEFTTPIDLSGYKYLIAEMQKPMGSWTKFRVFDDANYFADCYSADYDGNLIIAELSGMMKTNDKGAIAALDVSEIYRVGFWDLGNRDIPIKQVFATNNNPYQLVQNVAIDNNADNTTYNLQGIRIDDSSKLPTGIYIRNGKKFIVK